MKKQSRYMFMFAIVLVLLPLWAIAGPNKGLNAQVKKSERTAAEQQKGFGAMVLEFSALRHKLANKLSEQLCLPVPDKTHEFFQAAETGDWLSVSNRFEELKTPGSYGWAIPELRNELWASVHETLGIYEVWVSWKKDSSLLKLFYEPVLASMPKNSIYFGGTDYGRFVITTVNAVSKPPQIYCITQNALADNTYASHLRSIYGDIWLPENEDSARAFQRYVEEVKAGKRPKNANIEIVNGRVKVIGALGVMEINGIICEMIFEHNKDAHQFYLEESYVIDWMYPYLEPHGLIMKLNKNPLEKLPEEAVKRDKDFWKGYVELLLKHSDFADNFEAQKAFSKLRSAIAGIYVFRKRYDDAEAAFWQAIRLCPVSPEASFRLAKMYEKQTLIGKAQDVMESYLNLDPPYSKEKARSYLSTLREQRKATEVVTKDQSEGKGGREQTHRDRDKE